MIAPDLLTDLHECGEFPLSYGQETHGELHLDAERALVEARELLLLWYERWRGFVAGTPENMAVRTRDFLDAAGAQPRQEVGRQ